MKYLIKLWYQKFHCKEIALEASQSGEKNILSKRKWIQVLRRTVAKFQYITALQNIYKEMEFIFHQTVYLTTKMKRWTWITFWMRILYNASLLTELETFSESVSNWYTVPLHSHFFTSIWWMQNAWSGVVFFFFWEREREREEDLVKKHWGVWWRYHNNQVRKSSHQLSILNVALQHVHIMLKLLELHNNFLTTLLTSFNHNYQKEKCYKI
jgi:hypothetical protein